MKSLILTLITTLAILFSSQQGEYLLKELNSSRFDAAEENTGPEVELTLSAKDQHASWGQQIRYSIEVNDATDGSSRYGEIETTRVLLNLRYVPEVLTPGAIPVGVRLANKFPKGAALIAQSTCFGCHADKKSMVGPSFADIANAHEKQERSKEELISSISEGSSGTWGEVQMPPTPDYTEEEITEIVEYILEQGACNYCWVYPGVEGVFEIINQPEKAAKPGAYVVTASYTSSEGIRGSDTVLLKIE
ncbi:c-type cytochrome [Gracilimonas mengyeensis]|uniref:Cytochrome c551/c552 n=1 Tax=Gracilimonas mengyeensis TaxID=1302730 RepID=A0A521BTH3_9BACT|nr:c-type cytochrome [Gracilimonas mengyeensis]SMO50439.1 Cytochrome c551/c552 [Gracilimonas mengyeensis]